MTQKSPKSNRRRKWLLIAGGAVLLLMVAWFVVTSGPVVKAVVLPRAAKALQADLSVERVSLSPFSGVELNGVTLSPAGGEPLVQADRIRVRYRLFKLLGGELAFDEVTLTQPRVTVRRRADGGSDLTDWLARWNRADSAPAAPSPTAGAPLKAAIGKITIQGGTLAVLTKDATGVEDRLAVAPLDLTVDQIRNDGPTRIRLDATLLADGSHEAGGAADQMRCNLISEMDLDLGPDLIPSKGDLRLTAKIDRAAGRYSRFAGAGAELIARGSPARIEELSLSFLQDGRATGALRIGGGYDSASGNGAFDLVLTNLPPRLLDLLATSSGMEFSLAGFAFTNHVTVAGRGATIGAAGGLQVGGLTVRKGDATSPQLDLALQFGTEIQPDSGRGLLSALEITAHQGGLPMLTARVDRPFAFSLSESPGSDAGSRLSVTVTNLDLGDWNAVTGDLPLAGKLHATAEILSQRLGRQLDLQALAGMEGGSFRVGSNRVDQVTGELRFKGELADFDELRSLAVAAKLQRDGRPVLDLAVNGSAAPGKSTADLQTKLTLGLPGVAALAGSSVDAVLGGTLSYDGSLTATTNRNSVTGTLRLDDFDGTLAGARLQQLAGMIPLQLDLAQEQLNWNVDALSLTVKGNPALRLTTKGSFNLRDQTGAVQLALPLLNEGLLNPFLAAHSPQQRLRSGEAVVNVNGELQPGGMQVWTLASHSTNIVMVGTNGAPLTPSLGTRADLNVGFNLQQRRFEVRRWQGTVFADGRTSGNFSATGELRPDDGQARLQLQITGVNEHALRPLSPWLTGDRTIEQGQFEATVSLDYDRTKPSEMRARFRVADIRTTAPDGGQPRSLEALQGDLDVGMDSGRWEIRTAQLQSTPTVQSTNRLDLTGWIDLTRANALRGDLKLSSPGIDLTPVYDVFERTSNPLPATNSPPGGEVDVEASPAPPIRLPVDRFDVALDLRHLKLREVLISNWLAQATAFSNAVNLELFSLRLNGAPINARLVATNDTQGIAYHLQTELEGLPVAPLMHTFYPGYDRPVQALVFAGAGLSGEAPLGANLLAASRGTLHVGVTNAHYQPLNPRWNAVLRPVGLLLQTPELFSSPINWLYEEASLTNRTLDIRQVTVVSDAYVLDTAAAIPLQDNLGATPIPQIPLNLYLSRNLITQLGFLKADQTNETARYVKLPTFAHVTGTFATPTVETDNLKLTGMAVGKAGDFVGGTAGDVLKKAGGITETIGGVVSGRKLLGEDKQDANVVSRGIEGVFNAVGGILGGTGNAVEKGTGAVTGTKAVSEDVMATRIKPFTWPRAFTNAPNIGILPPNP